MDKGGSHFSPCVLLSGLNFCWVTYKGFPWWLRWKGSACNARDPSSITGSGRSPGGRHSNPLQYSCLENHMDRGAWRATVHGVAKSWTWLKPLSTQIQTSQGSRIPSTVPGHNWKSETQKQTLTQPHWHPDLWLPGLTIQCGDHWAHTSVQPGKPVQWEVTLWSQRKPCTVESSAAKNEINKHKFKIYVSNQLLHCFLQRLLLLLTFLFWENQQHSPAVFPETES